MKLRSLVAVLSVLLFVGCGGNEKKKSTNDMPVKKAAVKKAPVKAEKTKVVKEDAIAVDLSNKGIGPVKSLTLGAVDQKMAGEGKLLFKNKCSSCHKANRKFIGPSPEGILDRRSPEWVMNMILNPEEMVKSDPIAKALLIQFKGVPMANQHLTEKESRLILEYFRTL
ncbi:cytochrome c [Polaribacter sp. Z014]|uniref:c-type cytochrome n=1 Tax=Polaribacter sp. Z014 TaxID=2927126 RepID=UPI0020206E83|nr:c-type cytochrome [Polaribacter sp. Z014]MCL7763898.1 cytochrome c [Polaribacter sp. Z014]